MRNCKNRIKRAILALLAGPVAFVGVPAIGGSGIAMVAVGAALVGAPSEAAARGRGTARRTSRRTTHRTVARHTGVGVGHGVGHGTVRGTVRRTSRRTARRVTRRHIYTMPHGYRVVPIGAYRYYYYGGLYYYPYSISGRTTYVQVTVNISNPTPPPPVASITEEYYID